MKILHVTDFHFNRRWYQWLAGEAIYYDVCCFTGDFLDLFRVHHKGESLADQAAWVRDYLAKFPKPIFCCSGNHDGGAAFLAEAAEQNSLIRIDGANEVLSGFRLICAPWGCPLPSIGAFREPIVVLSHVPPADSKVSHGEMGCVGSWEVRGLAARLPKGSLVLSGHVHAPLTWCCKVGKARCFNPGVGERGDDPSYIMIDTNNRSAHLVASTLILANHD